VHAVIAESYERIHRSNLVGMGILPLQFLAGDSAHSLGLTGEEVFEIGGVRELVENFASGRRVKVRAGSKEFEALVRIDTPQEALYYAIMAGFCSMCCGNCWREATNGNCLASFLIPVGSDNSIISVTINSMDTEEYFKPPQSGCQRLSMNRPKPRSSGVPPRFRALTTFWWRLCKLRQRGES
jgi:hypothetical protein